ncbi:MAG TPA: DNA modification methylase [Candidatus Avirikenella pullistercoris]|nr:DNA modification methylase [Candidatus Avirikenella pullistercoris]
MGVGIEVYIEFNISVLFLKTDPKARYQGHMFYFREGFCWIDVNSTYLKARVKSNGIFDVLSMSLFTMTDIPDIYFVGLINSEFISLYVDNFINNTSHFQINDARQLPIIIPDSDSLKTVCDVVKKAIAIKITDLHSKGTDSITKDMLILQELIDSIVFQLYRI